MDPSITDPEHLSLVISHATAPAFLLGAMAGFVALLTGRLNGILDRIRTVNAISDEDQARTHLKTDLPRLQRRASLVNNSIYLAVGSAICTTILVIIAFVSALFGMRHEPGAALMFILTLGLMATALTMLAFEVRMALTEFDHHH